MIDSLLFDIITLIAGGLTVTSAIGSLYSVINNRKEKKKKTDDLQEKRISIAALNEIKERINNDDNEIDLEEKKELLSIIDSYLNDSDNHQPDK